MMSITSPATAWYLQDIAVVPLLVILPVLESQVFEKFNQLYKLNVEFVSQSDLNVQSC